MVGKVLYAWLAVTMVLVSLGAGPGLAAPLLSDQGGDSGYQEAIKRTAAMVWDPEAQSLAAAHGLEVLNVTWEDSGRYENSAVGPNISDVTIQVQHENPATRELDLTLMPVIRYPNFSDLTADVSPNRFYLLVGNESGGALERVSLSEYLSDLRRYLSDPGSWPGRQISLLSPRDTHVLVSAQAAFLPVPTGEKAEFNPVLFNYQSYQGDPAVLVIVATREGSSTTVIDNVRDAFPVGYTWGQRLFFNRNGERASFTAERLSDFMNDPTELHRPDLTAAEADSAEATGESDLNMVMLIQVPLRQRQPMRGMAELALEAAPLSAPTEQRDSDVEVAVIGHGPVEGPFTEIDGLDIERDPRFPIRVTVQFYKATSNGVVSEADLAEIATQIRRVYDEGDYVGSLVVDGPSDRPTVYDGPKIEPEDWWHVFWQRFEDNTGMNEAEARALWGRLRLRAWSWWPRRWRRIPDLDN